MVMGSSTMEKSSDGCINEQYYDDVRSKRPEFFPCSVCGRFFTLRAMSVHKRTCLENESCECSVCKSDSQKIKWESLDNKSSKRISQKRKSSKIKPRLRDVLTGKMRYIKNGLVDHSKLLTFKLVEENSCIIDKMVAGNKSAQWFDDSGVKVNGSTAINDHKNVSAPPNTFENSHIESKDVTESSCESVIFKEALDHDCSRKLFCCFCAEHFFWESFGSHVIQHCEIVQNNYLKCPNIECNRLFSQPALFLTHYLIHNSDHPLECNDCRCWDLTCNSSNDVIDEHGYADTEPFHCYICLAHFNHPQTVINHMRLHSKEMPFTCTVCNRSFRQIGNLQRHMATHRGDRPYKCSQCKKSFADPATLRNHERVHTGETPYVCSVCKRGFTQVGNLKRHMALHIKKNPSSDTLLSTIEVRADENTISIINPPNDIKINVNIPSENTRNEQQASTINSVNYLCDKNLKTRKYKRKNRKMKVFTCTICKKVYAWKHDLAVHFRTHTGEKPYECNICNKKFAQSGAVRIHIDRHHAGAASNCQQSNMS